MPINYNETRALISSSNTWDIKTVIWKNLWTLFFSDYETLIVDLEKMKYLANYNIWENITKDIIFNN